MSRHRCVWLDHREARILHIAVNKPESETIMVAGPARHIHRSADHLGLEKLHADPAFFGEVADVIADDTMRGQGRQAGSTATTLNVCCWSSSSRIETYSPTTKCSSPKRKPSSSSSPTISG